MFYELTIKAEVTDQKGNTKLSTMRYATDVELFAEAECNGLKEIPEGDVTQINRSNIREFINKRESDEQKVYKVKITDIFVQEDGSEKEQNYHVALFATDISNANKLADAYMKQGLNDMRIDGITKTRILDII